MAASGARAYQGKLVVSSARQTLSEATSDSGSVKLRPQERWLLLTNMINKYANAAEPIARLNLPSRETPASNKITPVPSPSAMPALAARTGESRRSSIQKAIQPAKS